MEDGKKRAMDKVEELHRRKADVALGGGQAKIDQVHKAGRLTARERVDRFFDPGTFVEIDAFGRTLGKDFGMDKVSVPADGVITGFGKVNGRTVCIVAQDYTAMAGTFGEMHGKKIVKITEIASNMKVPMVNFHESAGARLQEFLTTSREYGHWFYTTSINSGTIPQISAMMGVVAGGQSYQPGLTDFIFMTKDSCAFIAGPPLVEAVIGEQITAEDLGGAILHATVSGVCHVLCEDDYDCVDRVKALLSYLPSSYAEKPPYVNTGDDPNRTCEKLYDIASLGSTKPYDMHIVIGEVVDNGEFFEIHRDYCPNMIVGFARFNGHAVGIIANNPMHVAGSITCYAAEKAARFILFCDAFSIPIVYLVSTPAYLVGSEQERLGTIYRGATLLHATSVATVPQVTVIVGWSYAGAYLAMGSKPLHADLVYAWPTAEIGLVAAQGVVNVIFNKEIKAAPDPVSFRKQKEQEFRDTYMSIYYPASYQHIDDIIDPKDTRTVIIKSLEALQNKDIKLPPKKRPTMPL